MFFSYMNYRESLLREIGETGRETGVKQKINAFKYRADLEKNFSGLGQRFSFQHIEDNSKHTVKTMLVRL